MGHVDRFPRWYWWQQPPDSRHYGREGGAVTAFPVWAWVGFTALVVLLLLLDLLVLARGSREIGFRQATVLSVFWIALALLFGVAVFVPGRPPEGRRIPGGLCRGEEPVS